MEFKHLNLKSDKINDEIKNYFKTRTKENINIQEENKKDFKKITVSIENERDYCFDIFNTKRGHSLRFGCYKNTPEEIEKIFNPLGSWLIENASYGLSQKSFSLKMEISTLETLISFLEENDITIEMEEQINKKIYKLSSKVDKIKTTVTYYNTDRLLIQGKPGYCYWFIFTLLIKFDLIDNVIEKDILMRTFDLEKTQDFVTKREELLNLLQEDCKKMYESFLMIESNCQNMELADYSILCYYPLRISEAVLKNFIENKLNPSEDFELDVKSFKFVDKNDKNNIIKIFDYQQKLNSGIATAAYIKDAIEDLYLHFYTNRHGLFHTETNGLSRCIETKEEANEINEKAFRYMENLLKCQ